MTSVTNSVRDTVEAALRMSEDVGARLNAFIGPRREEATAEARRLDEHRGERGLLHGMPVAVKDNVAVAGAPMTAGSRILAGSRSAQDALAVRRLRDAGAVIVGRTNMHEFAWGGTSENPHYGDVHNPRGTDRIAGGSSGGSAAAVASGCVPLAVGTDTAGSIRYPAALTGIVGLRPTTGAVPVDGTFPLASTLDTVGPMSATVEDNTRLFAVLSGRPWQPLVPDVAGVRLATLPWRWLENAQPAVATTLQAVRDRLLAGGATWDTADVGDLDAVTTAVLNIVLVEASHLHQEWLSTRPQDYGADVRTLLEMGLKVPGVDYVQALREQHSFRSRMLSLFDGVDALISPTLPFTAPGKNTTTVELADGRWADMSTTMLDHGAPAALAGLPALSVPCGVDADGLPIGVQLIGAPNSETALYRIAAYIETAVH